MKPGKIVISNHNSLRMNKGSELIGIDTVHSEYLYSKVVT
jgi:hypothetical protein